MGLLKRFQIQPGEEFATLTLWLHSFFHGASIAFFYTIANTLFLGEFGAYYLPHALIASAITLPVTTLLYEKLKSYISMVRLFFFSLLAIIVFILFYRLGLDTAYTTWFIFSGLIIFQIISVISNIELWTLSGHIFNVRQGKRLFGFIGSGSLYARMISFWSVPFFVQTLGSKNIPYIAATCAAITAGIYLFIVKHLKIRSQHLSSEETHSSSKHGAKHGAKHQGIWQLLQSRYIRLIFGIAFIAVLTDSLVEYLFLKESKAAFPDNDALAEFFGTFYGAMTFSTIFFRSLVAKPLMKNFGLKAGLIGIPIVIGISILIPWIWSLASGTHFVLFVLLCAAMIVDDGVKLAMGKPTLILLYQPLRINQRVSTQLVVEGDIEPLALGISGGLLLLLSSFPFFGNAGILSAILVLVGLWIICSLRLNREYTVSLTHALTNRILGNGNIQIRDEDSISILRKTLNSTYPGEVLYALNILEHQTKESLTPYVNSLLKHPSEEVREYILLWVEKTQLSSATDAVLHTSTSDQSLHIRGLALQTLSSLGDQYFQSLADHLENDSALLRKGAMIGLLKHGGIDGIIAAGTKVVALSSSKQAEDRALAANILGGAGISSFYRPLMNLLEDPDDQVRQAAIQAAGSLHNPKAWKAIIHNLQFPQMRSAAITAILKTGHTILPLLEEAFLQKEQSHQVKLRLIKVCGNLRHQEALKFLQQHLDYPQQEIRQQILESMKACGYRAPKLEHGRITQFIHDEIQNATWIIAASIDIGNSNYTSLLHEALAHELKNHRKRIFILLSFIYDPDVIFKSFSNLYHESTEKQAYALEILDNVLPIALKPPLFPIIEELPAAEALERIHTIHPQKMLGRIERLHEIINRPEISIATWTQCCAIYLVGQLRLVSLSPSIFSALGSPHPIIRETSVWTLDQLQPEGLLQRIGLLFNDENQHVARMAKSILAASQFVEFPKTPEACKAIDEHQIQLLRNVLINPKETQSRRNKATQTLILAENTKASDALKEALSLSNEVIRNRILESICQQQQQLPTSLLENMTELIQVELDSLWILLSAWRPVQQHTPNPSLKEELIKELEDHRERIARITAIIGQQHHFYQLYQWYHLETAPDAQSKEITSPLINESLFQALQKALAPNIVEHIGALLSSRHIPELIETWMETSDTSEAVEETLVFLLNHPMLRIRPWARSYFVYSLAQLGSKECLPHAKKLLDASEEFSREIAIWSLSQVDPKHFEEEAPQLMNDSSPHIIQLVKDLTKRTKLSNLLRSNNNPHQDAL